MERYKLLQQFVSLMFITVCLSACIQIPGTSVKIAISSPETKQDRFTDPFAYCAAVGTIDMPDERYTGTEVPEEIIEDIREAVELADDVPTDWVVAGTVWRCMGGKVWACFVGANLPCREKADTSRTATPAMEDFCQANPSSDFIPAAVTGRATIYEWGCANGTPEIVQAMFEPDAQGFLSDFWYEIKPRF